MPRLLLILVFGTLAAGLTVAQVPPDIRPKQQENRDEFARFQRELLGLAQRLEASDRPADRERAQVLRRALDLIRTKNVSGQLQGILDAVKNGVQPAELDALGGRDAELNQALREILEILLSDDGSLQNKEEQERLEKLLAEARAVLRAQRTIRAMTESKRTDAKAVAEEQAKTAQKTKELSERMKPPAKQKPGTKATPPKDGDPKEGQPKDGQPKDGDPKEGQPKDGQPEDGQPKQGDPKDGQPPPGAPKDGPPPTPGRKQIQEAVPQQEKAEGDLKKDDRKEAAKAEDKAIKSIEEAIKELEKRLKQLREEEAQKLLANLETRCKKMLQMQKEVYQATKAIDADILKAKGAKSNADIQKSQQQADREREIVAEADKALKVLEGEGSAVAFAAVLEEVAVDMRAIERRLSESAVGRETQLIEENVIALLEEMVAALKKTQDDLKKSMEGDAKPGPPQKPGDQQLLDMLAELRLIKALQTQVNARTKVQGARYDGEQASDPIVERELAEIAARQEKLRDMLGKLERGENR